MADITLLSLREELEQKTAPFTVEYQSADGSIKEIGFNHLLTIDKNSRKKYYSTFSQIVRVATGMPDESDVKEFEGKEPYSVLADKIKGVFELLATDRATFRDFAKSIGQNYLLWDTLYAKYDEHFQVKPGE